MNADDPDFIWKEHYNGEYVDGTDMECHCPNCVSALADYLSDRDRDSEKEELYERL